MWMRTSVSMMNIMTSLLVFTTPFLFLKMSSAAIEMRTFREFAITVTNGDEFVPEMSYQSLQLCGAICLNSNCSGMKWTAGDSNPCLIYRSIYEYEVSLSGSWIYASELPVTTPAPTTTAAPTTTTPPVDVSSHGWYPATNNRHLKILYKCDNDFTGLSADTFCANSVTGGISSLFMVKHDDDIRAFMAQYKNGPEKIGDCDKPSKMWIGANDVAIEGTPVWTDGTAVPSTIMNKFRWKDFDIESTNNGDKDYVFVENKDTDDFELKFEKGSSRVEGVICEIDSTILNAVTAFNY